MEQILSTLHALIMAVLDVDPRRALLATLLIVIASLVTALWLKGKALAEKDKQMSEADARNDQRYMDAIEKHNARVDAILDRYHHGNVTLAQAIETLGTKIVLANQGPRQ